jgi:PAS domain S-box-containing protein
MKLMTRSNLELIIRTTSAEVGDEFFASLVECVSRVLEVDFAFIGELSAPDTVQLLAYYEDGKHAPLFAYSIQGTPCEDVFKDGFSYCAEGVSQKYPGDTFLVERNIDSCMALPVYSADKKAIGHIGFLSRKPYQNPDAAHALLETFAKRAGVELDRLHSEKIGSRRVLNDEMKLRQLLERAPVMIHSIDRTGKLEFVSDFWLKKLGYRREEVIGRRSVDFLSAESQLRAKEVLKDFFEKGFCENVEYEMIHKDGSIIDVLLSATSTLDETNAISRSLAFLTDISQNKKAEREIVDLNERLNLALNASQIGIWHLHLADEKLIWDERMLKLYGLENWDEKKTVQDWIRLLHPEDGVRIERERKIIHATRNTYEDEFRIILPDGSIRTLKSLGRILRDENNQPTEMLGVNWDITEEREMQKALATSAKFAALGFMAGGVAHEINNPLSIIDGYANKVARLLNEKNVDTEGAKSSLNRIHETTQRIAKVIKGMRSYARDGSKDPMQHIAVRNLIEDSLEMCRELIKNQGIELIVEMQSESFILCRPVEVSQVLLNLIHNSVDAIDDLSEKWIRLQVRDEASQIVIAVVDSGRGIPEAYRMRLMDPFFTTKEVGRGTGLGLSISKGIMEAHSGLLRLKEDSSNTCFEMVFPKSFGVQ